MENYLHGLLDEDEDPVIQQYLKYIDEGIPAGTKSKDILIIGAGMAGMAAAAMLKRAGHQITLVEANTRVGGRIKTFKNTPEKKYFEDDYVYGEAGAMRIPDIHRMVFKYIRQLNLQVEPFYYVSVDLKQAIEYNDKRRNQLPDKTRNSIFYVNDRKVVQKEYFKVDANINALLDYNLLTNATSLYENQRADVLLGNVLNPIKAFISQNPEKNWPLLIERWGEYSMRRFLKEQTLYSDNAIEMIAVLQNLESRMAYDFIQSFIESNIIKDSTQFWQIVGGTDKLATSFFEANQLQEHTYFDSRVTDLWLSPEGKIKLSTNIEISRSKSFYRNAGLAVFDIPVEEKEFDEVIVSIPFSAFRQVQVWPLFSQEKRKAIRELHYDSATKILLEFRKRWWEDEPYHIAGGSSISDLTNRFTYYPSMNIGGRGNGVLLASYCWSDEANRWDSMDDEQRYIYALNNVAIMHAPNDPKEQQRIKDLAVLRIPKKNAIEYNSPKDVIGAATQSWIRDPYAFGEAAIFNPGQLQLLQQHVLSTEWGGKAHFAGEHTSLKHAWIEGAIESGIRAALEVNETPVQTINRHSHGQITNYGS